MAKRLGLATGLCGAIALLGGCAETVDKVAPDVDAYGMPNAELALQRSMDRADAAMRDLGGMTAASRPYAPSAGAIIPAELQRPETFEWSGPIDVGAKTLADRIGYQLVVSKPNPSVPVVVSVNMTNVRILDLFEAIGTSAGTQATVIVDPDHRQIQVQYHV